MIPMALVLHYLLLLSSSLVCLLLVPLAWLLRPRQPPTNPKVFGFFHPYCSGGGGGERVLWKIIQNLQRHGKECVIYAVDPPTTNEAQLRKDAARRFDVKIDQQVTLVSLETYKHFLLPSPFLSLILESWGTMKLAYQALKIHSPDVFCDTTGCAFTFAVARWMHPACWIVAYVHYPTISTDMMQWEWQQTNRSRPRTILKIVYYWGFALLYGLVGSLADLVMVNSTWTYNHIARLWRFSNHQIEIVYPPCRVIEEKIATKREPTIVSIGQFRPEKNHKLQIEAVATLLKQYPEHSDRLKLLLIGSCRNTEDEQRVEELRELIKALKVEDVVEFSINPPNSDLLDSMKKASIGIHTMRQEHFGIGVVEMMAAGLLVIAHDSGGPQTDIVKHQTTGFLATYADDYAQAIRQALEMSEQEASDMRTRAQQSALRFSDDVFDDSFNKTVAKLLQ